VIRFGFGSFRRSTGKRVRMSVCVDISVSALGIDMFVIAITLYSCLEAHACVSFAGSTVFAVLRESVFGRRFGSISVFDTGYRCVFD